MPNSIVMQGSILQRNWLDTLVQGTGVLTQKGAWPLHLKNKRWQERQEKQKESARQTGCLLQEVKDMYGLQRGCS